MLFSRCTKILKTANFLRQTKNGAINIQPKRLEHASYYRVYPDPPKSELIALDIVGGLFWWWLLWNFWHSYSVITEGELPAPIPEHWSDAELGIPPDDDDE